MSNALFWVGLDRDSMENTSFRVSLTPLLGNAEMVCFILRGSEGSKENWAPESWFCLSVVNTSGHVLRGSYIDSIDCNSRERKQRKQVDDATIHGHGENNDVVS